ncbi:hypothetical protein RV11_GL000416 [Enterococcus phoeniculicola]|jgi:sulfur carrier protein ThiS|uniref:Uncharacterized protein n=1 Tax=Enterococcus phoeniculicola ATCC BAA-412 TaxID=1158610 RepID=R3WJI8_9ENTE|nr:hypothetical protein [Enterococcus phoeniculicola]EOL47612.1 hypothetical protein UC3_00615 [Enterococcus phoeniculicola ATCC BAA-412]EOT72907.1 hypothetical protein I589_03178 [Enterococcus phoeniculicola ATCC BAA-412]OJG71401.1 hypothetical protein RV11_GL000416 [Enterococcus phoeniculicola]
MEKANESMEKELHVRIQKLVEEYGLTNVTKAVEVENQIASYSQTLKK